MSRKKSGKPRQHTPAHTKLPNKDTDTGLIAGKLKDAASFDKKTDNFQVVTPFEHHPGTV